MAVINLTKRERELLSKRYDENKRTFERVLARDLRAFFAGLGDDIYSSFALRGIPPDFNSYIDELAAILKTNYRKVGAFFSSHIQRLLKELEPENSAHEDVANTVQEERRNLDPLLLLLLVPFYNTHSKQQAKFILDTTKKITNDIALRARSEMSLSGERPERRELARRIVKEVNRRNHRRAVTIAEDQVGDVAQKAKHTETVELTKAAGGAGLTVVEPRKTWVTIGDRRVRPAHASANGQQRAIEESYIVGGELLMYPKDRSQGASLGNTINCRCDSVQEI
jgi:uncharacterized protein with gpF-like domain